MWSALAVLCFAAAPTAHALSPEHHAKARAAMDKGFAFLLSSQNDDGSWTPQPGPAITALAVRPMLRERGMGANHPQVAKAVQYLLAQRQPDGAFSDNAFNNYNAALSISALSEIKGDPDVAAAITAGQKYLIGLQWKPGMPDPHGDPLTADHAYLGGAGYGGSGRPDMSNTGFLIQALAESGLAADDPAFQSALAFVARCQGHASNDMHAGRIINDGGFIYATSINKDRIGVPESKANPQLMDAALAAPGRQEAQALVSGLRTYGSITYVGFKSYLYANLSHDDPRVVDAHQWITENFDLSRNPGMPPAMDQQGLYYMYMALARALNAYGPTTLTLADGTTVDWQDELVDALVERQQDDGSWSNLADRWMEGNPDLVTAYALNALMEALD